MSTDVRTSSEIQRELEQERAQLASSLEALEQRFSIEGLTRQFTDQITQHSGDIGRSALSSVKSNPIPVALTGIGLAWMMLSDTRTKQGESESRPATMSASQRWDRSDLGSGMGHRTRASAKDLRERLHEGTEQLSESARTRVVEARAAAHKAQSEFERRTGNAGKQLMDFFNEQPMVTGALALAFGAALGAGLPRTHAEDSALGETSDRLFEDAERIFREEVEKAEKTAQDSASSSKSRDGEGPTKSPASQQARPAGVNRSG